MIITEEFLNAGKSKKGGWSKKQLSILHARWPPKKRWRVKIMGTEISDKAAEEFISLGGNSWKQEIPDPSELETKPSIKKPVTRKKEQKEESDVVAQLLSHHAASSRADILMWTRMAQDQCDDSPIERIMFIALARFGLCRSTSMVQMECQAQIEDYRVDFLIQVAALTQIVVECDGHEFHEKTKEQAIADRSRDRWLTTSGRLVLRFTGSEIWNNPTKCALEVMELVWRILDQGADERENLWKEGKMDEIEIGKLVAENRRMENVLIRIAFQEDTNSFAGNPEKWPSTIAYDALGGGYFPGGGRRFAGRNEFESQPMRPPWTQT